MPLNKEIADTRKFEAWIRLAVEKCEECEGDVGGFWHELHLLEILIGIREKLQEAEVAVENDLKRKAVNVLIWNAVDLNKTALYQFLRERGPE